MNFAQRIALLRGTHGLGAQDNEGQRRTKPAPSLAQRLQRLSVTHATVPRVRKMDDEAVARLLRGEVIANGLIQIDNVVPLSHRHGKLLLSELREAPITLLGLPQGTSLEALLFFDTETTGLAGGTGTAAILIGFARIDGDVIRIRQYFLTAFGGEAAMLAAARDWIDEAAHLVSFNGKSFDAPLLAARYRLALSRDPLPEKRILTCCTPRGARSAARGTTVACKPLSSGCSGSTATMTCSEHLSRRCGVSSCVEDLPSR